MIPLLTYPLALIGLAALPALAAIYLFRNRFRRRPVSSLFLWQFETQSKEGGAKFKRIQLPLLFFLELLAMLLLVTAAAGPRWQLAETARPLVLVLDDSLSMRAGEPGESPRSRAVKELESLLKQRRFPSIRVVLAGTGPRLIGDPTASVSQVRQWIEEWNCFAPSSALTAAIGLAADLAGEHGDILVITDHAPTDPDLAGPRTQWWAFGKPLANAAFVNATRTAHGDQDRCLLEIANYSTVPQRVSLQVAAGTNALRDSILELQPGARQRLLFNVPAATPVLSARLGDDALAGDNRAWLPPPPRDKVRVRLDIEDAALRDLLSRTLDATGLRAPLSAGDADLVIHQSDGVPAGTNAWGLRLIAAKEPLAFSGPFVVDTAHPLARGLELEGVVWAAARATNAPGYLPVITAGNVPLLEARSDVLGRHHLTLNLSPEYSTLGATPNWPILFWNLLDWRARQRPGLREANFRLGSEIQLQAPAGPIILTHPSTKRIEKAHAGGTFTMDAQAPGLYAIEFSGQSQAFAVNFFSAEESNLAGARSAKWGQWEHPEMDRLEYASVLWIFLLAALAVLMLHMWLITRQGGAA